MQSHIYDNPITLLLFLPIPMQSHTKADALFKYAMGMNPDVVSHLGDVYYYGTDEEFNAGVLRPVKVRTLI